MLTPLRPLFPVTRTGRRRTIFALFALIGTALLLGFPTTALAAIAPNVSTFDVTSTGATTATVDGIVNPEGQSTTYKVVYDTAASTWCTSFGASGSPAHSTTDTPLNFTDDNFHDVSVNLNGLTGSTQYCAEIVATNGTGSSPINDGNQISWTQGTPSADTYNAFSTGATTATIQGDVNPAGQSTTYKVVYDTAVSTWCSTNSGSPSFSTADTPLGATDSSFHDVSVDLTGLTANTGYCAEIVATNGTGSTPTDDGNQVPWKQGVPSAFTFDAFSTGATTATVDGQVNPAGQSTTYKVVYDTAASTWCTSFGASGSPASSTGDTSLPFTDSSYHDVSVNLNGLTAGTQYCAEVVATNGSGTTPTDDGDQAIWKQGVPAADTFDAFSTGATTATVDGQVNPAGQSTTYKVVYDTAASTWCTTHGASGSPASSTGDASLPFTDSSYHDVSVNLNGLTAGTQYCAEVVATNGSGTTRTDDGDQAIWKQGVPAADTFDAFSTGATTATVEGDVNPTGQSTTYKVAWDTAASTWCSTHGASGSPANNTSDTPLGSSDNTFHDVSVNLNGLTAGVRYCAEIVASNASGSTPTNDGDQAFWTEGSPDVNTFDTVSTSTTAATVEGDVNPAGQSTTYNVQYDVASSTWCTSFGASGSPAHTTADTPLGSTDSTFHNVSVNLNGLTAGTSYCAQLTATNAAGTAQGGLVQWTQGFPLASTDDGSSTGSTTATVNGSVNPAGQSTTYKVVYDTAGSQWCTSSGFGGAPAHSTADTPLGAADGTFHSVSVGLSGLTPGTGYCAEIVATNGTGSSPTNDGDQVTWTQSAAVPQHTLTVSKTGTGSGIVTSSPAGINCGSICSAQFDQGTQVTLTATASAGSVFAGWSGGGCSGTGTCQVTLNSDTAVTATFNTVPPPHTLTVTPAGNGSGSVTSSPAGINCGSTCSAQFAGGTQVTLTATAASGSTFSGWSGGGCSGTGTCQVTLNSDTTVTATFTTNSPPPPPVKCVVPKVKGKTLGAAKKAITKAHCSVGKITKVKSSPKNKGHVISQSPKPGKHLPKGSKVALKVGK